MKNSMNAVMKAELLRNHPKNPRKDLGDLEELTKSIRKNGIMQNLTVIPVDAEGKCVTIEDGLEYWVLIGNRRFQAGLNAGLFEFPCNIVENLSEKEQLAIMLEENMQRTDLTVIEQAEGFQMMLDLGETVESIVEKTGFKKTTVYHRLNLAKLDKESLEEKQRAFQLNISDLYALEQIKNVNKRNEVLSKAMSSNDIKVMAERVAREEQIAENIAAAREWLDERGILESDEFTRTRWSITQNPDDNSRRWINLYSRTLSDGFKPEEIPELPEGAVFEITKWDNRLTIVIENEKYGIIEEREETPEQKAEREKREEQKIKKEHLEQLQKDFKNDFNRFVKRYLNADIDDPNTNQIITVKFLWDKILLMRASTDYDDLGQTYYEIMEDKKDWHSLNDDEKQGYIDKLKNTTQVDQMLLCVANALDSCYGAVDWSGKYTGDDNDLKYCKDIMQEFGISINREIFQLIDGTHPDYRKD